MFPYAKRDVQYFGWGVMILVHATEHLLPHSSELEGGAGRQY